MLKLSADAVTLMKRPLGAYQTPPRSLITDLTGWREMIDLRRKCGLSKLQLLRMWQRGLLETGINKYKARVFKPCVPGVEFVDDEITADCICVVCTNAFKAIERGQTCCSKICGQKNRAKSLLLRLEEQTQKTINGCWLWQGPVTDKGYGLINVFKEKLSVHRVGWEVCGKELIDGLVLDHTCENKTCWNPEHLEQVTNEENVKRYFQRWHERNAIKNIKDVKPRSGIPKQIQLQLARESGFIPIDVLTKLMGFPSIRRINNWAGERLNIHNVILIKYTDVLETCRYWKALPDTLEAAYKIFGSQEVVVALAT